jgi:Lytic polysaccharide mono-oxygenase, cellulose-degrading
VLGAVGMAAGAVLVPSNAEAHFTMASPPQWIAENSEGDPQKSPPCGVASTDPASAYMLTNIVTTFAPGQTITLKWAETIAHDGWFRILLSYEADRADLVDPPYAVNAVGFSTDAGIEVPPVAPVLVDGLFKHTAASVQASLPKSYTYNLTLPTKPCAKCTLQIQQVMLNHPLNTPGAYTYHHCADIAIVAGGDGGSVETLPDGSTIVVVEEAGPGDGTDDGGPAGEGSSSGGGADDGGGGSTPGNRGSSSGGGSSTDGSSGGCAASPSASRIQTAAVAGVGLVLGALVAAGRRRRRAQTTPRP